ncbi:2-oxoacid:acceptor oxidoreductase family protein [bacterium]|nr:2-oxoacid:acceptor oxidoreductase family protein [bacterium]
MIELRFHSRGGQGGVIAGKILSVALFKEGKHVQSFPSFGVERRAAPVMTFVRFDDKPIRIRSQVYNPDHLVIMDPSLINYIPLLQGLKDGGIILISSERDAESFGFPDKYKTVAFNAAEIALRHRLGTQTQPIINTAVIGAWAKVTGFVSLEAVIAAVREEMPFRTEDNALAAAEAYEAVL